MKSIPVIAIFDIGKTNKKFFLFDEYYNIVYERTTCLDEIKDEDGFPCEDLENVEKFVVDSLNNGLHKKEFKVKAVNVASYGASFVYIGEDGRPLAPLYNYLKPYPQQLLRQFYDNYKGEEKFSLQAASPVLGSLNSGMQIYRIKYEKPELFQRIKFALHLPQYLSYLLSGKVCSDITSIGCHTNLWNFTKNYYHEWLSKEHILKKLAPLVPSATVNQVTFDGHTIIAGAGLHDTSAALIPYLINFREPFVLISTGTWCISLNPFNHSPLTPGELKNDCLCYMQYEGKAVKASRIFAGNEHEQKVKQITTHFHLAPGWHTSIEFDPFIIAGLKKNLQQTAFGQRDLAGLTPAEAYHQLILDIVVEQQYSTKMILDNSIKRIFVDGGFAGNAIYMNLLAAAFPGIEVFAASLLQGTALGTALCIHHHWNRKMPDPGKFKLKLFSS